MKRTMESFVKYPRSVLYISHLRCAMTILLEKYRHNHVCWSLSDLMAAVPESSAAMGMERRDWLKVSLATISRNHELYSYWHSMSEGGFG